MVLILVSSSKHGALRIGGTSCILICSRYLDYQKIHQIRNLFRKRPILLITCATCFELPSYISTMPQERFQRQYFMHVWFIYVHVISFGFGFGAYSLYEPVFNSLTHDIKFFSVSYIIQKNVYRSFFPVYSSFCLITYLLDCMKILLVRGDKFKTRTEFKNWVFQKFQNWFFSKGHPQQQQSRKVSDKFLGKQKSVLHYEFYYTVCPGSRDPFYTISYLYKMGHYFLDTQYSRRLGAV